ncbi:class I SAM-dependent methyltransferase [Iodobacter ciconiae]|uniref:Class I SAM-dependent methyltransferase n=1 Tax=Iodobacter ciconiae TaxID=2496266 RepID=A0A3S8ZWL5_9NEIS|nr:class I SAM-dependent methyltransferase [Iodobacter ciconiae]AZN37814.1 class I SAM-dependent methyltransferase [Iodobacter ciconiae]
MNNRFEEIYATNEWGTGSGEGSLPIHTQSYIDFLEQFTLKNKIKSVLDMGCGDWQFSKNIHWDGIQYQGYDVVKSVVSYNQQHYTAPNIRFQQYSGNPDDLPNAELIIAKDVLQHLSNQSIECFIKNMTRYPYALITNCVNPGAITINHDINTGDFRYLDLRLAPFHLSAREVFSFTNADNTGNEAPRWLKKVLLIENHSTPS